jgi:hypothetical protein
VSGSSLFVAALFSSVVGVFAVVAAAPLEEFCVVATPLEDCCVAAAPLEDYSWCGSL